jgi:hypothetical protein
MKVYRVLWLFFCIPLIIVGVGAGVVLTPGALAPWFVLFAVLGAISTLCAAGWYGKHPLRHRPRFVICSAFFGAATACAIAGFAVLWGAVVLLLIFAVLLTSPAFLRAYDRWRNSPANPSVVQLDAWGRENLSASLSCVPASQSHASPELGDLTTMQLCRAWRASHWALKDQSSADQMMATVAERQKYLVEFERRNPNGFAAWLASDDRRLGNPLPFLMETRDGVPTINWDDLTRLHD